jgi:hypothetical protein
MYRNGACSSATLLDFSDFTAVFPRRFELFIATAVRTADSALFVVYVTMRGRLSLSLSQQEG